MNWWPHHPSCFCWKCRRVGTPHPADRCHCERCLGELEATQKRLGELPVQGVAAEDWSRVDRIVIPLLQGAGYHISPVGEIEGDVYVEIEQEAVELWKGLL